MKNSFDLEKNRGGYSASPYDTLPMTTCLTPVPPDRLRRGYAAALWKISCHNVFIVLPSPAAG